MERSLTWREMNYLEALDVMRAAETAVVAVCGDGGPWATPMHVQLEMQGVQPVLHLSGAGEGRRLACLMASPRVTLLFLREDCTGTSSVAAEGEACLTPEDEGVRLRVPVEKLGGRHYFK